jgi:Helix-turn-helix domain
MNDDAHANSPADAERARLLDLLDAGHDDAPTIDDLRERGVTMPGQAIYELELDGYRVERVRRRADSHRRGGVGYCLRRPRRRHMPSATDSG